MAPPKFQRQTPRTEQDQATDHRENGDADVEVTAGSDSDAGSGSGLVEELIEDIVSSQTAELRAELEALEEQVEEVDRFARVSLNERKVKQNEARLSEFSESLTAFAEKAFNNINTLEDRLDRQALVLAAVLESLDGDVDLSSVHRYENDRLVEDASPRERLSAAVERGGDGEPVEDPS